MRTLTNNASIIDRKSTIVWLRRDLRLDDNTALFHALQQNNDVIIIFIFDENILNHLADKKDRRVTFIYQQLQEIQIKLISIGTNLIVFQGRPEEIMKKLDFKALYFNRDYEPYALARDMMVESILTQKKTMVYSFKDQVIFEKNEVCKNNQESYTIYTPYSKKWKSCLSKSNLINLKTEKYYANFKKTNNHNFFFLADTGFQASLLEYPPKKIKVAEIRKYHLQRDFPSLNATSQLSIHLRFGTISIRRLAEIAWQLNEIWLNELIWRDFFAMILFNFPSVVENSFKPKYNKIKWLNNNEDFKAWQNGLTGYPLVDAGMRELNATGLMHNRVRMVTASFLTKHLLIDWRWGEKYFAEKLLDFDLASNNGNWQWAAGCGCDSAPYFRVFNPTLQAKKFDPGFEYIKKWVPEFNSKDYPKPIISHELARTRVLEVYREALS